MSIIQIEVYLAKLIIFIGILMPSNRIQYLSNREKSRKPGGFIESCRAKQENKPKEVNFTKSPNTESLSCEYECGREDTLSIIFNYKNVNFPSVPLCNPCFVKIKTYLEQAITDFGVDNLDNEDEAMKSGILAEAIDIANAKIQTKKVLAKSESSSNSDTASQDTEK